MRKTFSRLTIGLALLLFSQAFCEKAHAESWSFAKDGFLDYESRLLFDEDAPLAGLTLADYVESEAVPSPAHQQASVEVTHLAGTPAAIFLVLQGIFFIGLVKGRRKWVMILIAAFSAGRTGLNAIPKILSSGSSAAVAVSASQPLDDDGQRVSSDAHAPGIRFISLLKGLDTEPAPNNTARYSQKIEQDTSFVSAFCNTSTYSPHLILDAGKPRYVHLPALPAQDGYRHFFSPRPPPQNS